MGVQLPHYLAGFYDKGFPIKKLYPPIRITVALGVTNEKRKPARLLLEELFARAEIKFRKETTIGFGLEVTSTMAKD